MTIVLLVQPRPWLPIVSVVEKHCHWMVGLVITYDGVIKPNRSVATFK
jgi:hypothetical protein